MAIAGNQSIYQTVSYLTINYKLKRMITFEKFMRVLREAGSKESAKVNSLLLGGVDGMPVTHQTGYGAVWRKGIPPHRVDRKRMNRETHERMIAALAVSTATIVLAEKAPLIALLTGFGSSLMLRELYRDWKAGFEAARHLPNDYFLEFPPIKQSEKLAYRTKRIER